MVKFLIVFLFVSSAVAELPTDINFVPGEFLIQFDSNSLNQRSLKLMGVEVIDRVTDDIALVSANNKENNRTILKTQNNLFMSQIRKIKGVLHVEPNYIWRSNVKTNDTLYKKQWGLNNTSSLGVDINAEKAWDITTGSNQVVVAVIDSGIDYNHQDIAPNLWYNRIEKSGKPNFDDDGNGFKDDIYGYNFIKASPKFDPWDDDSHGTHCAGVIGAAGNNSLGVVGVNWSVKLMGLKFLDNQGAGTTDDAIRAIDYATKMGVNIISASWGSSENSKLLRDSIARAAKANILFVTAAGNEAKNNDFENSFPANYKLSNVVSVAAIDRDGALADFSNYGIKKVHVAAPGVSILSTVPGNKYRTMSGTSMATPFVAGVAALVLSKKPGLAHQDLKKILLKSVKKLPSLKGKVQSGGMLDSYQAVLQ